MLVNGHVFGHGAELALGEVVRRDGEDAVKAGASVFPRNDGGEFHEFRFGKVLAEGGVELIGNVSRGASKGNSQAEDGFFAGVEAHTGFELREVMELVFGDARVSAHGRMDVNSKRTTDHQGSFELRELFEAHGDEAGGSAVHIEAGGFAQVFGDEGADADAQRDATEAAFHEIEQHAREWAGLVVLNALRAEHGSPL
jgi:hypothetical protein